MSNLRKIKPLSPKSTALFLCDYQDKFAPKIQYFPAIVNVASRILKAAKLLEMPIVVTEQYPQGLGPTSKELGLSDYPDIVPFPKKQFSMLIPEVDDLLRIKNPDVTSIVLCGVETHVCVQCTTIDLLNRGYEVHVVVDACSSRSMVDRMYAFQNLQAMGALLTTSESALICLLGDAEHEKYQELKEIIMEPAPDSGILSLLQQPI